MGKRFGLSFLALLGLLIAALPENVESQVIRYVNRTDSTCAGKAPCYETIQAAINAAQPRDTIRIQAGIYSEQLTIEKNNFTGAVEADRIIIESDPEVQQEQVVLQGPGGSSCTNNFAIRIRRSKFITIRGLTITGAGAQAITLQGGNNGNQAIHIELNRIFANGLGNNCSGAIEINEGNSDTILANNLIYRNGRNAIQIQGSTGGPHYIVNNTIYGNHWNGFDISAGQRAVLANNLINLNGAASGNQGTRFGVVRAASGTATPQNLQLRNNLICGNTGGQISGPILDGADSGNFTPLGNEGPGVSALPGCDDPGNLFANRNGPDNTADTIDDDFNLKQGSLAIEVGMDPRTLGLDPLFHAIFEADFRVEGIRPADGNADRVLAFDASAFEYPNAPPIANAGVNATVYRGQLVTLDGSSSNEPEGAPLGFLWEFVSQPAGSNITLTGANTVNPTFTPLMLGNYILRIVVNDGQFDSEPVTVTVTAVNRAPSANAGGPYNGVVGMPVQFSGAGTDPDGDGLTFSWAFGDGGTASGQTPTHIYTAIGTHSVILTVTDSFGAATVAQTTATIDGVSINNIAPPSGVIGTLVAITGSNYEPGATQVTFNGVAGVIRSITATEITTTVPPSASTGAVTVTTSRGSANRNFVVPTSQDFLLGIQPSSIPTVQGGAAGVLIDAIPSNEFSGLIQLATGPLPAGVVAAFSPANLAPKNHALLTLRTSATTPSGAHVIEIRGNSVIDGQTVTRTGAVTLNVAAPGQTILVGQVVDGDERPLADVSIKLGGPNPQHLGSSDAAGNLFIPLSISGSAVFLIDASPANSATTSYPTIPITLNIQPGVINELGYVPRLRGQPVAKLIPFVPGQATVIDEPDLPGFKMTIPAGAQIIGWDGQPNNRFGVTTVPIDRSPLPPMVLPPGLEARETYLFSFGKVGGGVPTGNIPIDLPNNYGALPGEKVDLYYFNEAPDGSAPNQWEKYGTATVSLDGKTLVTDINPATGLQYGIPRFCCGALTPVFNFINRLFGFSGGPNDGGQNVGDPVDVSTGYYYVDKTDMVLPGRLPVVVTRTYRSNLDNLGPFGLGTSASFDIALAAPDIFQNQSVVLISPGNRQDSFSVQANGTYVNTSSPALRGAVISTAGSDSQQVYTLKFKDGSSWQFNSSGRLIRQADRHNNAITYGRDNFGRVASIQEPGSRSLSITYSGLPGQGLPNIRSITDPIGRQVFYSYDPVGRLETVTDPTGGVTRYGYDSANRMVTVTDPRGIVFLTNEYDADGRVARQTEAGGGIWTFAYTNTGGYISQAVVTNPRGHATTYRFNAAGYQISETDPLGQTTIFERQAGTNQLLSVTDPLKRTTRFQYDTSGNVTQITDPAGNARTFSYNLLFNKVTSITDPLGHVSRFEYNNSGDLNAYIDPLGNRSTIAYNNFGQPINSTDPQGNTTTFAYDSFGFLNEIADPLGNRVQRRYDSVSRLISQTDPRGKVTGFTYNGLNQITGITDPIGGTTELSYDGNGNLVSVIDPRGGVTLYGYNAKDQVATRTDPLGATESFQYDTMGNLVRWVDRKGQQTQFSYDALNRRVLGSYQDGTTTNFVYDAANRLIQARDSFSGIITSGYDVLDRLVGQVTNLGNVSYAYDRLGRRTEMTVPGQASVSYSYDANSRLRQLVQGSQVVSLDYDTLNRRTQLALPNGVTTEYQYDAASRLTALVYRNAFGVMGDLNYLYDKAGHRTGVGGSLARTMLPDPVTSAQYDMANRQLQFGNNAMAYDPNGNLTTLTNSIGVTNFTWDARNRLKDFVSLTTSGNFAYDVFGRRARKTIGGQTTQFLYDGANPVQEHGAAGVQANILGGLEIDEFFSRSEVSSARTSYYLSDAMGSTISLADPAGIIQSDYAYEPFGRTQLMGAPDSNAYQYTSRENDGNGMYYYRARYYHPSLQRFISEDPVEFAGGDINLFAYAQNNPTNFRDPSGNFVPAAVVGAALCTTGAVAAAAAHQHLSGRKSTFTGFLASAAAGCVGGLGFGWLTGIVLETTFPSIMLGGGQAAVWGGLGPVGPQLAATKAAEIGAATIYQTFTGSTLSLLDAAGAGAVSAYYWPTFSANFVSGAGSATVLVGRGLSGISVLVSKELPALLKNKALLNYIFYP